MYVLINSFLFEYFCIMLSVIIQSKVSISDRVKNVKTLEKSGVTKLHIYAHIVQSIGIICLSLVII